MATKIEIPEWFEVNATFNAKWIGDGNNWCKILQFNEVTNLLEVEVHTTNGQPFTEDGWNLEHTIHGFERGDYTLLSRASKTELTLDEKIKVFRRYYKPKFKYTGFYAITHTCAAVTEQGQVVNDSRPNDNFRIDKCVLVLKDIADITEDHFNYVIKLERKALLMYQYDKLDVNKLNTMSIQFLADMGYMVPIWFGVDHWANGKSLFELKIAVNEKTLK